MIRYVLVKNKKVSLPLILADGRGKKSKFLTRRYFAPPG